MSCFDDVNTAASPKDAMLALARHVDDIRGDLEKLANPLVAVTPDPWAASWSTSASPHGQQTPAPKGDAVKPTPLYDAALLREQIANAHGDDRRALEARLRLLTEGGGVVEHGDAAGTQAVEVQDGDDRVLLELPPPSSERRAARAQFLAGKDAHNLLEGFTVLAAEDFEDAYIKGGPLWLYHYDRAAVMQMPLPWRQQMVADIAQDSPKTAQQIGRDILKATAAEQKASALPLADGFASA